ncbi:SDR family NAD(P)-dependent oxidoreductase [Amycolatopsis nivea]
MSSPIDPIAIVGMAGRFPGARDVEEFWANLLAGRSGLRTLSEEQLRAAGVPAEEFGNERYVRVNGDAPDVDLFDAGFFRMTPREAAVCDPQLRLFLETAHAAVENAGYDPARVSDVGVFAGVGHSLYWDHNLRPETTSVGGRDLTAGVFNYPDYVSTLVSYKLDFTGPSMTVLTACSSSLLTLHLAVQALHNGECEMALVGGSDLEMLGHGYAWSSGSPVSRDGRCRSFDADASGTVFTSGVGVVAVKRLSDALADGDRVRAVIRSTAVNNDGSDKVGFSAPSVSGQTAVVLEALALGGTAPEEVGYVEAHGTGTPLGDPIEFTALTDAFHRAADGRALPSGYCGLGSVKSNVGHLGHAAGVAALIKTVLCLENERLVPTLHVDQPNPRLEWERSPFSLVTESRAWPRMPGKPRVASINSLGFGGTNVHAVLEEAPLPEPAGPAPERPRLLVWSGRTEPAEREYRPVLAKFLAGLGAESFADAVHTLQLGRTAHPVRAAVVAESAEEAAAALGGDGGRVLGGGGPGGARPVVFAFPGQGAQHVRLARGLHGTDPVFTRVFDECLESLAAAGADVRAVWREGTEEELARTDVAQPVLFACEYALARMWLAWGIRPVALLGHSIGELAAAAVAGVFTASDAARIVAARGRAMAKMPPGAMLAVRAAEDAVAGALPAGVAVAAANGPEQTVVSGPFDAIEEAERMLAGAGFSARRLRTSHAFHSAAMAPAAAEFEASFSETTARAPEIPVYSAATGALMTAAEAADPAFWAGQLTSAVRFSAAADAALADGDRVVLEVGPGRTLAAMLSGRADVRSGSHLIVGTLPRRGGEPAEDVRSALAALGTLWTEGHDVDWAALGDGTARRLPMPGYRYQRSRHWIDPPAAASPSGEAVAPAERVPEEPAPVETPFATTAWAELPPSRSARRTGDALVLLPAAESAALPLVLALQQAGMRIVPVRPGEAYADDATGFRVRPGNPDDLERVLRTLAGRGRPARTLVHAWSAGPWEPPTTGNAEEQLDLSCRSLAGLLQRGARAAGAGSAPGILVLTSRSADVSGGEPVDPVKATLHGVVRTFVREAPGQECRLIDLGPGLTEDEIVAELTADAAAPVVALRRDRRWVRSERPHLAVPGPDRVLRRDGVYLVTGGAGGLGLEVAKGLARSGLRPRLALVGRTDPFGPEARPDRAAAARAALDELASLGAQVRFFAADVADARAMRRVADTATARFGPVNGIFHLAGVAGDGMLLFRDRDAFDAVLRPKVLGALVLEEVFGGRPPLDFFVSFASRAGLDGLVGSGDYAAANAFLDAQAPLSTLARGRVLSIDWPAWAEVGMAANPGRLRAETVLSAAGEPFADEHRVDGRPVLPGTGILDLVYRNYFATVPGAGSEGALRFSDVVLRQLLVLAEPRRVSADFEPRAGGWSFTVSSEPADGGARIVHATGDIGEVPASAPVLDPDAVLARVPDRRPPRPISSAGRVFQLGPRWDNAVEQAFADGDRDTQVVTLRLPPAFAADLPERPLHPALLDTAFSSARDPERDGTALPFMYRSVVVHGPLEAEMRSLIVRQPSSDRLIVADVTVFTPEGKVLVECTGFTLHAVDPARLAGVSAPAVATAERADSAPDKGIAPEAGVRMLLELLAARPLRQVAVRPFRDGRPAPGGTGAPFAAEPPPLTEAPAPSAPQPEPEPAPSAAAVPEPGPEPAADDAVERTRRLWSAVLGVTGIRESDDFFEIGGNSLAAIDLASMVRTEFGFELNVAMLFDYPTLGALAEALRARAGG